MAADNAAVYGAATANIAAAKRKRKKANGAPAQSSKKQNSIMSLWRSK
jgi:hypothetical protein